jgi:hypothetical protein
MDHLIVLYQYHISALSTPRNSAASVYGFMCASRRLASEIRFFRQEQWPALRIAVLMMTADPVSGKCFCNLWVVVIDLGSFELVVLHASYILTWNWSVNAESLLCATHSFLRARVGPACSCALMV